MLSLSPSRVSINLSYFRIPRLVQAILALILSALLAIAIYHLRQESIATSATSDIEHWKSIRLWRKEAPIRPHNPNDNDVIIELRKARDGLLREALRIKDAGYHFRILVFAWKRRASLKRLLDSLMTADYFGFTVHLEFHMDGGSHPLVVDFIEQFQWSHGRKQINRHGDRVGLERTIMSSWTANNDKEFAFFFEDDIEMSSRYFEYCLLALHKYIIPYGRKPEFSSPWVDRMVGFSLNTPRYNEIIMPPQDWTPIETIGKEDSQFLFQLPCSWGALYFPWKWRQFLQYYHWRAIQTSEEFNEVIPDSATKYWRRSWKKFLIELMYMRGEFMLYASLENQVSFSTHHREPGEHTEVNPEEPLVDELTSLFLYYFTVPLIKDVDEDDYLMLVTTMKPFSQLPVVSFHHDLVPNLYSLLQVGWNAKPFIQSLGWQGEKQSTCLLDDLAPPLKMPSALKEKYLIYMPQASIQQQISALQSAIAHSYILNRTLIIPHFVAKDNSQVPLTMILSLQGLDRRVKYMTIDDFVNSTDGTTLRKLPRIIYNLPWEVRDDGPLSKLDNHYFNSLGIPSDMDIVLNTFPVNSTEIKNAYNDCQDRVLAFKHLCASFASFDDPQVDAEFKSWIDSAINYVPFIKDLIKKNTGPGEITVCGVFSRAGCDDATESKMLKDEGPLIFFRNCKASPGRTIEYLLEDAATLKLNVTSVYLINEADRHANVTTDQSVKLLTRQSIMTSLKSNSELSTLNEKVLEGLADLVEFETCASSAFFLGNQFSLLSAEIIKARGHLLSNILGKKVTKP